MFRATIRPDLDLRLFEERHAKEIFVLVEENRDYLREWLSWVDHTNTEGDIGTFIHRTLAEFAAGDSITAGIWFRDEFAGVIGTHNLNRITQRIEIGYWLAKPLQGHGIITDCCRALITHLFEHRQLNRVEIHCAVPNAKSAAIARRLGFQLEGTLRDATRGGDRLYDAHIFGMLKREWRG
jgi:ribosomal-protein-serine acetyltransferase